MTDEEMCQKAWNAGVESATFELGVEINDSRVEEIKAPSEEFQDWFQSRVVNT